jgi:four helix bundle protein
MHNFKELVIWQEAMKLAKQVYEITASFPLNEKYGLCSQMNRSVVSIPSNIAEGSGRGSDKEFTHFLSIALGSAYELETQLLLAQSVGFVGPNQLPELLALVQKIQRMINKFKDRLKNIPKS